MAETKAIVYSHSMYVYFHYIMSVRDKRSVRHREHIFFNLLVICALSGYSEYLMHAEEEKHKFIMKYYEFYVKLKYFILNTL